MGLDFWLWLWVSYAFFWIFCVAVGGVKSLMVVGSGFVISGGDETRFGCGFHVLYVESRG